MKTFKTFYIDQAKLYLDSRKIIFSYHFDAETPFLEEVLLPDDFEIRADFDENIAQNILFHASIAFGMSYYKLFPTEKIIVQSAQLSDEQKDFWRDFYISGLGEFFYTNNIDFRELAYFESSGEKIFQKIDFSLEEKSLLPIGGGKDSIVSSLLLETQKEKITPYIFGKTDSIKEDFLKIYQKDKLLVKRKLDATLFEMNKAGYYNGHIPITGLISFITFFIAYIYNYKQIIFSNERSANTGSVEFLGREINHQYSKSEVFENKISQYLKDYISSDMKYFSLLRKYYEIEIAKIFTERGKKYFSHFSSCNRNFSLTKSSKKRWCNECPKCLFVYMILRPFLTDKDTLEIFGEELYEKKSLETLFYETIGYSGIKPFECVGETAEAELAAYLQYQKHRGHKLPYLLERFQENVFQRKGEKYFEKLKEKYLIHL